MQISWLTEPQQYTNEIMGIHLGGLVSPESDKTMLGQSPVKAWPSTDFS